MAAPFVAGVAALILSREREQDPNARLVQRGLEDLFGDTAYDDLADGDFNLRTGWGLIAPARILSA
jgi:subtilisin family serine protease